MTLIEKQTLRDYAANLARKAADEESQAKHYAAIGNDSLAWEHRNHRWSLENVASFLRDMASDSASARMIHGAAFSEENEKAQARRASGVDCK